MSLTAGKQLLLTSAAGSGAYQISRSLRFSSPDSSYCGRVPATAGNRTTWSFSAWIKRSKLATTQRFFVGAVSNADNDWTGLFFDTSDQLVIGGYTALFRTSNSVYRDCAAWYHLTVAADLGNSSNSLKFRAWINNVEVTWASTSSNPSTTGINSTGNHTLGAEKYPNGTVADYCDLYLAECFFIDGQALDPSSFAETDATTGQWVPKAYTGSYGTNGFHLAFDSYATTAALGTDTSGNGNTWTVNNFSVAPSGSTAVTVPATNAPPSVEYLVIGGGGGGGATHGGGGGAGGYRSSVSGESSGGGASAESPLSVTAGASYSVTVGAGGTGGSASDGIYVGSAGTNSVFGSITSNGGAGAGGGASGQNATSGGGSGGGAGNRGGASNGTANQGFNGGTGTTSLSGEPAGGGGGAGSNGSNGTSGQAGNGGSGVSSSITGTSIGRAGGGGGAIGGGTPGSATSGGGTGGNPTATAGTANTGGGGGGGGSGTAGQPGGSGVVIIRYANTYSDLSVGGGLTYTLTNTGGYKIYTFTASSTPAQAAGNDSLVDTPTSGSTADTGLGGQVTGNYCTWNPLDNGGALTLTNGNLDAENTTADHDGCRATIKLPSSGKWYFEGTVQSPFTGTTANMLGVATSAAANPGLGGSGTYYILVNAGGTVQRYVGGSPTTYSGFSAPGIGSILQVAYNADTGNIWFGLNNTWMDGSGGATGNPSTGSNPTITGVYDVFPATSQYSTKISANWGARSFAYTAPSGCKALCDTNLPTPVVAKPNTVMDVVLYTGTGAALTPASSLGFNPDWIWIKSRSAATDHALYDVVRGAQARLESNTSDAEVTTDGGVTAFNSAGFTLGTLAQVNTSSATYAAWCWDGGTTTVTNTAGSITSQVRANPSAGFSICTYTTSGGGTVGHGLGVTPAISIAKRRSGTSDWYFRFIAGGINTVLLLNSTASGSESSTFTSTVVNGADLGSANEQWVLYNFAPVSGYSNAFTYTGNGSSDGPFCFLGFRPRFLIIKRTDAAYGWYMYDTARDTYNIAGKELLANASDAEVSDSDLDILSNGFKPRRSSLAFNASGGTFIGFAWAESPFQYARAR